MKMNKLDLTGKIEIKGKTLKLNKLLLKWEKMKSREKLVKTLKINKLLV